MKKFILITALLVTTLAAQISTFNVSVSYVGEKRVSLTDFVITYVATLHNNGTLTTTSAIAGNCTSSDSNVRLVTPCAVSWPAGIAPGGSAVSTYTFSVQVNRTLAANVPGALTWTTGR